MNVGCKNCSLIVKNGRNTVGVKNIEIMLGNVNKVSTYDRAFTMMALSLGLSKKSNEVTVFPVVSYAQMLQMKGISSTDLQSQKIIQQLKQIVESANAESKNPNETALTPLNIEGKLAFIELPKDFLENNSIYRMIERDKISCSGSCSGGTCALEKFTIPFVATVYWCQGCG